MKRPKPTVLKQERDTARHQLAGALQLIEDIVEAYDHYSVDWVSGNETRPAVDRLLSAIRRAEKVTKTIRQVNNDAAELRRATGGQ
jgi:hypothetical protein